MQRIDESEMAEDKSILTVAGKNNSWLLLENKELGLYTNLLGNSCLEEIFTGEYNEELKTESLQICLGNTRPSNVEGP